MEKYRYDFTDQFGASANEGILTPKIAPLLKATVKNFIMDGEMMGWDKKKKSFGSKGKLLEILYLQISPVSNYLYQVEKILNSFIIIRVMIIGNFRFYEFEYC